MEYKIEMRKKAAVSTDEATQCIYKLYYLTSSVHSCAHLPHITTNQKPARYGFYSLALAVCCHNRTQFQTWLGLWTCWTVRISNVGKTSQIPFFLQCQGIGMLASVHSVKRAYVPTQYRARFITRSLLQFRWINWEFPHTQSRLIVSWSAFAPSYYLRLSQIRLNLWRWARLLQPLLVWR